MGVDDLALGHVRRNVAITVDDTVERVRPSARRIEHLDKVPAAVRSEPAHRAEPMSITMTIDEENRLRPLDSYSGGDRFFHREPAGKCKRATWDTNDRGCCDQVHTTPKLPVKVAAVATGKNATWQRQQPSKRRGRERICMTRSICETNPAVPVPSE